MTPEEISFFDSLATDWDAHETISTPEKVSEMLSIIGVGKGWDILDLGTGTGVLLPELSRLCGEKGRVEAVDVSTGMLERAEAKFGGLDNVRFRVLDFEKETIAGRYDLIMLYCVYPHMHNPASTLRRLAAVNLKPSGRIVIAFPTDEKFINNIHKERKAESDILPPANVLSKYFSELGLKSSVLRYDPEHYIVAIEA